MKEHNILAMPLQSRSNPQTITSLVNVFDILIYGSNQLLAGKQLDLARPVEEALPLIDTQRESYILTVFDYRDTMGEVGSALCLQTNLPGKLTRVLP